MTTRPPVSSSRRRFTSVPGFTDRKALPKLGKIRLGVTKTKDGREYPSEVDYFVFDPDEAITPDERKSLIERFHARYGERAVILDNVVFASVDREEAFSQSIEWWGQGKRLCHGDGEEAERLDRSTGEWRPHEPCANSGQCPEWNSGKQCQFITRLRVMLPEISMAGYFQLDTGSKYSSANLRDCINLLELLFGQIHGIPLTLARVPQKIEFEGKANTHYIVHLRAPNLPQQALRELVASNKLALAAAPTEQPIELEDDDMPDDLVPRSEQSEPAPRDEKLEAQIETGFARLEYSEATRASLNARFGHDRAGLLNHLRDAYRKREAAGVTS